MAQRELKVTITVRQNRGTQTMHVRAAGKRGTLLLGKIKAVAYRQPLTSAGTEQLFVHDLLTTADALVLSL